MAMTPELDKRSLRIIQDYSFLTKEKKILATK